MGIAPKQTAGDEFVLYSYFRSSASYRARIALHLKKIDFVYKPVHLLRGGGEQQTMAYRKQNPSGQVPTLVHNGRALGQSLAIMEYLDEICPEPAFYPRDSWSRAQTRQLCEIFNSGIQPLHNLGVLQELGSRFGADEQAKKDWTVYWILKGLRAVESILEKTAGTYCMGGQITAADICLVPQVFGAQRYNVDFNQFPIIQRVNAKCCEHPAFKKAHPSQQPDSE